MLIATFLAGIGIGAELPLVDTYLSELLPARCRGRYTAWGPSASWGSRRPASSDGYQPRAPFGISG
jgi:putative MFS transporter